MARSSNLPRRVVGWQRKLGALFDDDGDLDVNRAAALALFVAAAALMTEPLRARFGRRPAEALALMAARLWNTSWKYHRYK